MNLLLYFQECLESFFLKFLQAFLPLLVYSFFTLDHTQLISLHSCVFRGAILVITGGLILGRSQFQVARSCCRKKNEMLTEVYECFSSNKTVCLGLGKQASWEACLHFTLAPTGICGVELYPGAPSDLPPKYMLLLSLFYCVRCISIIREQFSDFSLTQTESKIRANEAFKKYVACTL